MKTSYSIWKQFIKYVSKSWDNFDIDISICGKAKCWNTDIIKDLQGENMPLGTALM